jgi:hypothetical protein
MSIDPRGWHADHDDLERLLDGRAGQVLAASLESHLMACDACSDEMNRLAFADATLDEVWQSVRRQLEDPAPSLVERALAALARSPETGRLLTAVPAMRAGWLAGVVIAVTFAGLAAVFAEQLGLAVFLLCAPMAPVAGVAAAFGGEADPSSEIVSTTPYSSGRLLTVRTLAVLVTSVPVTLLVGLALPGPTWLAVAWLGPALAGVSATLAAAPVLGFPVAGATVCSLWSLAVGAAMAAREPLALVGPAAQAASLVLVAGCACVLAWRSQVFDLPRRLS